LAQISRSNTANGKRQALRLGGFVKTKYKAIVQTIEHAENTLKPYLFCGPNEDFFWGSKMLNDAEPIFTKP